MNATIQSDEQAAKARARVAELSAKAEAMRAEREGVSAKLGEAMAALELGDRKASAEAGKLSMKRSTLTNDLDSLTATIDALRAALATWEADAKARERDAALADLETAEQEAKRLEKLLAEQLRPVLETAQAMDANSRRWTQARIAAGRAGGDCSAYPDAPQGAAGLLPARVLEKPALYLGKFRSYRADRALQRAQEANPTPPRLLEYTPPPQQPVTFDDEMIQRIYASRGAA